MPFLYYQFAHLERAYSLSVSMIYTHVTAALQLYPTRLNKTVSPNNLQYLSQEVTPCKVIRNCIAGRY